MHKHLQQTIFLLALIALCALSLTSCQRGGSIRSAISPALAEEIKLNPGALSSVPQNSIGFFVWDSTSSPFERLGKSPWGQMSIWSLIKQINPKSRKTISELGKLNLDLTSPKFRKKFNSLVIAIVKSENNDNGMSMLSILDAKSSSDTIDLEKNLKRFLKNRNLSFSETTIGKSKALKIGTWRGPLSPSHMGYPAIYFATHDKKALFSDQKNLIAQALESADQNTPQIFSNPAFAELSKDFPNRSQSYAYGFLDLSAAKILNSIKPDVSQLAWAFAMEEAPVTFFRARLNSDSQKVKSFEKTLGELDSNKLLNSSTKDPISFVSLSGALVNLFSKANQSDFLFKKANLEAVRSMVVSASIAPFGGSILPLPAISAHFKSSNPKPIEELVSNSLLFDSFGSGQVREKSIKGWDVTYKTNPMTLSSYLSTKNDDILLASNEKSLEQSITSLEDKGESFLQVLDKQAPKELQPIAYLRVNFENLARYLESLGGMLAMFAPKISKDSTILTAASLERIRVMGRYEGYLSYRDHIVSAKGRYFDSE